MAYVFQYGSNTSSERLNSEKRLNGNAVKISIVQTIDAFDFDFTVWSRGNKCAAADLVPNGQMNIWGVLYEIPDERVFREKAVRGRKCLDQIEGPNYERIKLTVADQEGNELEQDVWTYVVKKDSRDTTIKTSKSYTSHILDGLEENNISQDYIDYIKDRIRNNNPELLKPEGELK